MKAKNNKSRINTLYPAYNDYLHNSGLKMFWDKN